MVQRVSLLRDRPRNLASSFRVAQPALMRLRTCCLIWTCGKLQRGQVERVPRSQPRALYHQSAKEAHGVKGLPRGVLIFLGSPEQVVP